MHVMRNRLISNEFTHPRKLPLQQKSTSAGHNAAMVRRNLMGG